MSQTPFKKAEDFDDERQRAFVLTALAIWTLVFLFMVLRDPVWRLLHEGELVSPLTKPASGWTKLDEKLIRRLSEVKVEAAEGVEPLERAVVAAINARRKLESQRQQPPADPASQPGASGTVPASAGQPAPVPPAGAPPTGALPTGASPTGTPGAGMPAPLPPIVESPQLRALARSRAAARLAVSSSQEVTAPELRFPETYLALSQPRWLVRSVEIHQQLPATAPVSDAGFANELVGGWMNRLRFSSTLGQGRNLELGVGAVASETGTTVIEVLLMETFVELDDELPAVVDKDDAVSLRGRRFDPEEVIFYFKGPSDPGFFPLDVQWTGDTFSHQLVWEQDSGNYAVRAGRGDRLSDPRPIFVD